jgi:anti-sigma factor RsiW
MVVSCEEVWREISNYLEGDIDPGLRAKVEGHFGGCQRCSAVLDGTRNIVQLYGDERMLEVPLGFSNRLQRRVEENIVGSRRGFLRWMVPAAAAVLIAGTIEVWRSSLLHRRGTGVPPDMLVVVSTGDKAFHVAGCAFIVDKAHVRTVTAREAEKEGCIPCVHCMKKYLTA